MNMKSLGYAQIYVGTYSKYNSGSLFGKWLDLSDYADKEEFMAACKELHKDEEDPEYMFQDWEGIPESLICESWLSENFFPLRDALAKLPLKEQKAFLIWSDNGFYNLDKEDFKDLLDSFNNEYFGEAENVESFAFQLVEDCYDLPEFAKTYFDYSKFARDLFIGDFWYDNGFVFRRA